MRIIIELPDSATPRIQTEPGLAGLPAQSGGASAATSEAATPPDSPMTAIDAGPPSPALLQAFGVPAPAAPAPPPDADGGAAGRDPG